MILDVLDQYLNIYPEEKDNLQIFIDYLSNTSFEDATDWNNFNGHIVAGGFLYAKKDKKFLMLYHRDLETYLYPGGHMTSSDSTPYDAAVREVIEETGISDFKCVNVNEDYLTPLDIHIHNTPYNKRLDLPEHYHFDFRYLFVIDSIEEVKIDEEELAEYQWVDIDYLKTKTHLGHIIEKIDNIINTL